MRPTEHRRFRQGPNSVRGAGFRGTPAAMAADGPHVPCSDPTGFSGRGTRVGEASEPRTPTDSEGNH